MKQARAIKGQTPFTPAMIREAATLSAELLREVTPAGAKRKDSNGLAEARKVRDQFAALLDDRYQNVEHAAGALWGRGLGEHVPVLQGRVKAPKKARKTPNPKAPTPTDGTPTPERDG